MYHLKTLGTLDFGGLDPAEGTAILAQPKRVGLLLYLVLAQPGAWYRRDTLLGLLWGDLDESRARNALSQALHHLRRGLGADSLPGQGLDLVRANHDLIDCDAVRFEALVDGGRPEEALALYEGDLAPGLYVADAPEFEQWLSGERRRLKDLAFTAAVKLADAREAAGDHAAAATALRRAVDFHPEDETTLRRLMQLLGPLGDRASALRAYEDFAARLRTELDVDPSPETQAVARGLRERSSEAAPGGAAPGGAAPGGQQIVGATTGDRDEVPSTAGRESAPPGERSEPRRASAASPANKQPRRFALFLVALLAASVGGVSSLLNRARPTDAAGGGQRVVVAPFRLAGADPDLAYLREGLVDLLAVKLSGAAGPRALDPRAVLAAWRGATGSEVGDLTPEDALLVTHRLGAERLILGGVVGRPERLVVSASLRAVPDGKELARATVEGNADSLPELVDRLAGQLLALNAGEDEARLAGLGATSLSALRSYLAGQVAFRGGRYADAVTDYSQALAADSNLTLAAVGLASAGQWTPTDEAARRSALALAWRGRDRLRPADRAYLVALAGPRYPAEPTARERLVAWEEAARLAPDRPDVWYEYGDVLFHKGALLGVGGAWELARSDFERAVRLDSTYAAASLHLFEVLTADGEVDRANRLAAQLLKTDSTSEHAAFIRWRLAVARGDAGERGRVRATFGTMSVPSLWRIIGTAQLEGVGLDDAALAARELERRPSTREERLTSIGYLADLALNQGRAKDAARLVDELPPDDAGRPLIDALYAGGDTQAAVARARALGLVATRPLARDSVERAFQLFHRCALVEWRLWQDDTTGTRTLIKDLSTVSDANAPWWAVGHLKVCAALIDALRSAKAKEADAGTRLAVLDSVLQVGLEVGVRESGNLASQKLHELLGDTAGALAALRRREYHFRTGIPYLATRLENQARLAAALGEKEEAEKARRHYLALRRGQ